MSSRIQLVDKWNRDTLLLLYTYEKREASFTALHNSLHHSRHSIYSISNRWKIACNVFLIYSFRKVLCKFRNRLHMRHWCKEPSKWLISVIDREDARAFNLQWIAVEIFYALLLFRSLWLYLFRFKAAFIYHHGRNRNVMSFNLCASIVLIKIIHIENVNPHPGNSFIKILI